MRKGAWAYTPIVAGIAFLIVPAVAAPSAPCGQLQSDAAGIASMRVIACGPEEGAGGTLVARYDSPDSWYVVADGNPENPEPLAGYAGVENGNPYDGGAPAIVACFTGEYTPPDAAEGSPPNHVVAGADGSLADPVDGCAPFAEA
jgi:hypothetical protein